MKNQFDIENFVERGSINSELEYERAMIADRKLRLMAKDDEHFKDLRSKLRRIIEDYEKRVWSNSDTLTENQVAESDFYEMIAENERLFLEKRKQIIRDRLKLKDLTQNNLCEILGHRSKTHMSELMNGIKPFTLNDLVIIHRVLKIDLEDLVPVTLSKEDQTRIKSVVSGFNKSHLKLEKEDLIFCQD